MPQPLTGDEARMMTRLPQRLSGQPRRRFADPVMIDSQRAIPAVCLTPPRPHRRRARGDAVAASTQTTPSTTSTSTITSTVPTPPLGP